MNKDQFCKDLRCVRYFDGGTPCCLVKHFTRYQCKYGSGLFDCIYLTKEGKIYKDISASLYSSNLHRDEFIILSALIKYKRNVKS